MPWRSSSGRRVLWRAASGLRRLRLKRLVRLAHPDALDAILLFPDTWDEFKATIGHAFGDVDREEVAYEKFQKVEQGNRTAAAYWAELQKIKADLPFAENMCIARFRSGLNWEVRQHLVMNESSATDLATFATTAIKADSRLCHLGVITRQPAKQPESRHHITSREPAIDPGDSMDLDATRRYRFTRQPQNRPFFRKPNTGECFQCGKKGHYAKECPDKTRRFRKPYRAAEATMENPEGEEGAGKPEPAVKILSSAQLWLDRQCSSSCRLLPNAGSRNPSGLGAVRRSSTAHLDCCRLRPHGLRRVLVLFGGDLVSLFAVRLYGLGLAL
jgi:hypothetical protein